MNTKRTFIIYTDGSSRPNPGHTGYGIHGYVYTEDKIMKNTQKPLKNEITTNGYIETSVFKYADKNTVAVRPDIYIDGYRAISNTATNNVAEVKAYIDIVYDILTNPDRYGTIDGGYRDVIRVYTDSAYLLNVVNIVNKDNNWTDRPNQDLLMELSAIHKQAKEVGVKIYRIKVPGHSTNIGNNRADRLAFLGMTEATNGNITEDMIISVVNNYKYWRPVKDAEPMLDYAHIFISHMITDVDGMTPYVILDYKTNTELGKPTSDALYGVVLLGNKAGLIEKLRDMYYKVADSMIGGLSMTAIDTGPLYGPEAINDRIAFGDKALHIKQPNGPKIYNLNEPVPVVRPVHPPGKATNAMNLTLRLIDIYKMCKSGNNTDVYETIDITDSIYETNKEKGTQRIIIGVGENQVPIKNYNDIKLIMGKDIPRRNNLSKFISKDVPCKVTLICEHLGGKTKSKFVRYYVQTESKYGIGIWCNMYSTVKFKKL